MTSASKGRKSATWQGRENRELGLTKKKPANKVSAVVSMKHQNRFRKALRPSSLPMLIFESAKVGKLRLDYWVDALQKTLFTHVVVVCCLMFNLLNPHIAKPYFHLIGSPSHCQLLLHQSRGCVVPSGLVRHRLRRNNQEVFLQNIKEEFFQNNKDVFFQNNLEVFLLIAKLPFPLPSSSSWLPWGWRRFSATSARVKLDNLFCKTQYIPESLHLQ